jgi:hypothetical protein
MTRRLRLSVAIVLLAAAPAAAQYYQSDCPPDEFRRTVEMAVRHSVVRQ